MAVWWGAWMARMRVVSLVELMVLTLDRGLAESTAVLWVDGMG